MLETEVAVVGGGPAGAAAAVTLARRGCDVVVVDKARFPRDKYCGDGLTAAALRELEALGLRPDTIPSWEPVHEVWLRSPSGHTVGFPLPASDGLFAAVAKRAELDSAVLDLAQAAGAKVHDGHALSSAVVRADAVVLDVEGLGSLSASYVVGADGMWSPLRHALGVFEDGYLGEWHAFRQYFSGVGPAARALWVWFEADLLPGYAWSFPVGGGRANVGFGIHRDGGIPVREMKAMWPAILSRAHVREVLGDGAEPEGTHRAWPIPARVERTALTAGGGRVLFVGDAARATDPMTGEGIAQALVTGRRAAESILAGGADPVRVAARYRAAVGAEFFADHRLARLLSRALSHRKGARIAIRVAGATGWTRRNFARWLFEDYPRAVALTPRRWKRGTLRAPGAYR